MQLIALVRVPAPRLSLFGVCAGYGGHVTHALDRAFHRAGALGKAARVVSSGLYSHAVHNVDRSLTSHTKIGSITVHSAATDARGIAADIEPHLHRGQAAERADYGMG